MFDRNSDLLVGAGAAAGGSAGLVAQFLTQFGSAALVGLNLLLAAGGLYLLYLRIVKARRDLEGPDS